MHINLVYPPDVEHAGTPRPSVSLAAMAAYIKQRGHTAKIYDIDIEGITNAEEIATYIMRDKPQIIGFSCMTPRIPISVETAAICKRISSDVITIVGGPHATGDPVSVLRFPSIDYAIIGEGEGALLELMSKLEAGEDVSGVPNLVLRIGDSVKVNPARPFVENLDELPFPAWDLLPINLYKDPALFKGVFMGIISSRGCLWNCSFCASPLMWRRKLRMRSAENVVEELKKLVKDYNITNFQFYDDNFTQDRRRVLRICELIKKEGLNINFRASLRADAVHYDAMEALKNAGCSAVFLGVESGDEDILKQIRKGLSKDQIRSAVAILKKVKIPIIASYMIGHPGDTHDSIRATIDFAKELDSDQVKFLISTPFPGTRLYDLAKEKGLISDSKGLDEFTTYQHVGANLSNVSDEELKRYQRFAYEGYDLRKRPLI